MKQARSTFGSNFPHRAYHSKQDKITSSLPPLAWGRHDVQVEENFWKQAQGKLASVYHQSSDDLTMIHTLSGDSAQSRPAPVSTLRSQLPGLPDFGVSAIVHRKIVRDLDATRKAYMQTMSSAVGDSKLRQANLGLPMQRIRYYGRAKPQSIQKPRTPCTPQGLSAADRVQARLMQMKARIPSRSPTPLYPWQPPEIPDREVGDNNMPQVDMFDIPFADKVLTLLPGRKL